MVLWQQELYLHPIPSGDRSGLVFVFGKGDIDLNTAPRDTSLRRALLDHWPPEGDLIGGACSSCARTSRTLAKQLYRRRWSESRDRTHCSSIWHETKRCTRLD